MQVRTAGLAPLRQPRCEERGSDAESRSLSVAEDACERTLGNRTVALVQIVEGKQRESRMTVPEASELARAISQGGRATVYGIYFDTNQAELKPESTPALEQIAKLLQAQPTPVGVSSASPLDTNKTDEGRSKNRRVEIVEQ